jgi:DNA-binding beta-propeller fold protein YncE
MEIEQQIIHQPYIGPRPFRRSTEDQKRFFGRDEETNEIISLILGHKVVLIYAQSGAGKTSIFNAQIVPTLTNTYGFQVLPTARVVNASGIKFEFNSPSKDKKEELPHSSFPLSNSYMFNALQSINSEIDSKLLIQKNLSSFLKDYFPINNKNKNIKIKAQLLIFDQLEELFRFYPDDNWRKQQEDFFKQVAEALEENPLLRIVLVIREDYLAELDHFIDILPGRLRTRYRLERLGKDAALLAIKGPLERMNINLDLSSNTNEINKEIDEIVNDLLKIRVEDPLSGKPQDVNGEFVEPIQLQVVCQRWWRERFKEENQIETTSNTSNIQANLKNLINVDSALEDFYVDAINESSTLTGIYEGDIRIWCEKKLITSSETRSFVHRGAAFTSGMPNKVVESLEKKYLIRGDETRWYELTHDRLIKPILDSNKKWKLNLQSDLRHRKKIHNIKKTASLIGIIVGVVVSLSMLYPSFVTYPDSSPLSIAVNPYTNIIYASNFDDITGKDGNSISVIDGKTNEIVGSIPGIGSSTIAINPSTNMIYAADDGFYNYNILVIDGKTNEIVGSIPVEREHPSIAINPSTNMIYTEGTNNTISVIDGKTNEIVGSIPVPGIDPSTIVINPSTNMIYAADDGYMSLINGTTHQNLGYIGIKDPSDIAINPSTNKVYIANRGDFRHTTITVASGTTPSISSFIEISSSSPHIVVNPITNMIYELDIGPTRYSGPLSGLYPRENDAQYDISIIDGKTNEIVGFIPVPGIDPSTIAINPSTNLMYVASSGSERLGDEIISVIDCRTNQTLREISSDDGINLLS